MRKRLFKILPKWIQMNMIRSSLDLSNADQNEIQYKLAETEDEFREAFELVHKNYVQLGFIEPQPSKMRLLPHHQLETTAVIVAKHRGYVIGTVTLVRDGYLGLPMESKFKLDSLRQPEQRMAEVTCLAVHPRFRRAQGGIIFPCLMKFVYEFAVKHFGVQQLVAAVYPKDALFYESLFGFSLIDKKPLDYFGAPAVGLHLDLSHVPASMQKVYGKKPLDKNLSHFFVEKELQSFSFTQSNYDDLSFPELSFVVSRIASQLPAGEQVVILQPRTLSKKMLIAKNNEQAC